MEVKLALEKERKNIVVNCSITILKVYIKNCN